MERGKNMKKCPYCGRRISYMSGMLSRRKNEYVCTRCGKESKVVVNKFIFLFFALMVLVAAGIMAFWIYQDKISNPMGIIYVSVPFVIFMFANPSFLKYLPLKKYKKSMEAKKAGRVYSENIAGDITEEFDFTKSSMGDTSGYEINSNVFDSVKKKRVEQRMQLQLENSGDDIESSQKIDKTRSFVPVISDTSENHASMDAPLKKIHNDSEKIYTRSRHYIPTEEKAEDEEKKADNNKYSANRKF